MNRIYQMMMRYLIVKIIIEETKSQYEYLFDESEHF